MLYKKKLKKPDLYQKGTTDEELVQMLLKGLEEFNIFVRIQKDVLGERYLCISDDLDKQRKGNELC